MWNKRSSSHSSNHSSISTSRSQPLVNLEVPITTTLVLQNPCHRHSCTSRSLLSPLGHLWIPVTTTPVLRNPCHHHSCPSKSLLWQHNVVISIIMDHIHFQLHVSPLQLTAGNKCNNFLFYLFILTRSFFLWVIKSHAFKKKIHLVWSARLVSGPSSIST